MILIYSFCIAKTWNAAAIFEMHIQFDVYICNPNDECLSNKTKTIDIISLDILTTYFLLVIFILICPSELQSNTANVSLLVPKHLFQI